VVSVPRRPVIKHKGSALSADLMTALRSLEVDLSVHRPGVATLRLTDRGYGHFDKGSFAVGDDLEVLIPDARNKHTSVFKGELTGVGIDDPVRDGGSSSPALLLRGTERTHRLAASSVFKAYLKQSYADIVKDIAGRHGLSPKVDSTGAALDYVLQNGTDLAMLSDIASRVGMEFFIDGTDLVFRARKGAKGPTLKFSDTSLRNFSASYVAAGTPSKVEVFGWDPATQKDVKGKSSTVSSPSADLLGSSAPFLKDAYGKALKTFGQPLAVGTTPVWDDKEADALAAAVAHGLVSSGLMVEGMGPSNPAVRPGVNVAVEDVGRKLKGDYYATSVTHSYAYGKDLTTTFRSEGHAAPDRPTTGQFAPGAPDGWGSNGLVLGVVTNINDSEGLGRVKVRFPSLGAAAESNWARVVSPGAGPGRGLDLRPEVNDEVVVAFERGDMRTPLVLGGVWSPKAKLPDPKAVDGNKVDKRVYVSGKGHSLEFSDKDGHVQIELAGGKTVLKVADDGITIESAGKPIKLDNGKASLALTDSGDIVLSGTNIKIDAKMGAKIKGASIEVKGSTGVKVDGGLSLDMKGTSAKVEGAAMLTLKGGMVKIN